MRQRTNRMSRFAFWGMVTVVAVVAGTLIRLSVEKSGDTIRTRHIKSIATSIKANSLDKENTEKYFYPTHFSLMKILRKGNLEIPSPYDNICYFVGSVQNPHKNSSDFIVMTWGTHSSTLNENIPGIIYETSSPLLEKVMRKLSPTLDKHHFQCKRTSNIPWKKDMSPLLKMKLFPTHWLKINAKEQICLGISETELPPKLTLCIPEDQ